MNELAAEIGIEILRCVKLTPLLLFTSVVCLRTGLSAVFPLSNETITTSNVRIDQPTFSISSAAQVIYQGPSNGSSLLQQTAGGASPQAIFDNTSAPLGLSTGEGNAEIGDVVIFPSGTPRNVTQI